MSELLRNQYAPTSVSPPGDTLLDLLEEQQLSQAELASRLGRPVKTVNEIVKGKTAITPETAIQLERALGTPAEFWLVREAHYREWLARRADDSRLDDQVEWLRELPVNDMVRLGWCDRAPSRRQQVATCLTWFGVASVDAWRCQYQQTVAHFRIANKPHRSVGAIAAWLRAAELEAAVIECRPFNRDGFRAELPRLRSLTLDADPSSFVPRLRETCAQHGVAVVFRPTPSGCPANGATRWLSPDKALVQLSLRYRTNDVLWFTFFHEAAHILMHGKKRVFLEERGRASEPRHAPTDQMRAPGDESLREEQQADRFARDLLIPVEFTPRLRSTTWSRESITAFASEIGVAPGIVLGRLQNEGLVPWSHFRDLKISYTWD